MRPVEFPEQTHVIAKDQPQYLPLPALVTEDRQVISCWGLTWRERLQVLFTGRVWLTISTYNSPLQPQRMSVERPFYIPEPT